MKKKEKQMTVLRMKKDDLKSTMKNNIAVFLFTVYLGTNVGYAQNMDDDIVVIDEKDVSYHKITQTEEEVEQNEQQNEDEGVIEEEETEQEDVRNEEIKEEIIENPVNWNLSKLFRSLDSWYNELDKFTEQMNELANYSEKVASTKTHLFFAMEIKEELDIKISKLYAYIKLNQDVDTSNYKLLDAEDKLNLVYTKYIEICNLLEQQILSLSDEEYEKVVDANGI